MQDIGGTRNDGPTRFAQHYASLAVSRRSGDCTERGLNALGPYTWTYGSVAHRDEAETYWREFEATLHDLKRATDALEAQLAIFVSPLVFDIDSTGRHAHFNEQRLDFACATIAPRDRLSRIAERNFTPFFFAADDNHFNQVTAGYVAEHLAGALLRLLRPH